MCSLAAVVVVGDGGGGGVWLASRAIAGSAVELKLLSGSGVGRSRSL